MPTVAELFDQLIDQLADDVAEKVMPKVDARIAEAIANPTPEPAPEPTPDPEQPEQEELPLAATAQISNSTGGEWQNGVSVQTSRFMIRETTQARQAFVKGATVKFSDGQSRKITDVAVAHGNIYPTVEGDKLPPSVGYPNTVSAAKGESEEAEPEGELPATNPEPAPVTGKGLICVNLGLGMGGDTLVGGLPGREGQHYFFPNQAEFDFCASLGFPRTRCGFISERAVPGPTGKGKVAEEHAQQMIRTARYAKAAGIKVLWDMHNYSGHSTTNKSGDRKKIGTPEYPIEALGEMWFRLLDRLMQDPDFQDATYGFDSMNEPTIKWNVWKPALQHAVNRIAEAAPGYMVACEGIDYSNTTYWAEKNPGMETITHPQGKQFLEFHGHLYLDNGQDGFWKDAKEVADEPQENVARKRLAQPIAWKNKHGLKFCIGETNVPGIYPRHQAELDILLGDCVKEGIDVYPFYIARNAAGSWHDLQKPENKSTLDIIKKYSMVQR